MTHIDIEAKGIRARVALQFGMISELVAERDGRTISMLHKAPWLGETTPQGIAPHLAGLAGDFFCAPFGDASADGAPVHGWSANTTWTHLSTERNGTQVLARFRLDRKVMGAGLIKELRLVDGHPFLYQRHVFNGGHAVGMAIANHAMVSLPDGGRLSFSPKRWWETSARQLEPDPSRGRSLLACPAHSSQPTRFPLASGGEADLTRYPFGAHHEDFVAGVEAEGNPLGWTTVAREQQRDLFISLRNPAELPVTHLWFSNGGRDYPPWNGRHLGCLGIEEGMSRQVLGWSASQTPNPLDEAGVRTGLTFDPDGSVEIRHVTGSLPWDASGTIESIAPSGDSLKIRAADGATATIPCEITFLRF